MVLLNLLQDYKSKLYDYYVDKNDLALLEEKIRTNRENQELLEKVIGTGKDDLSFFDSVDINSILFLIRNSSTEAEIQEVSEKIHQIRLVYDAISKKNLPMTFTIEQLTFMKKFRSIINKELNRLKEEWYNCVSELNSKEAFSKENDDVEEKIITTEDLIDKIEDPENIELIVEFDIINELLTNNIGTIAQQKRAITEIDSYNSFINREKKKPNISSLNAQEFINYMVEKKCNRKIIMKYIDEISQYGDFDNMKNVFETIEKIGFKDYLTVEDLMSIMLFSTPDKVELNYKKAMELGINEATLSDLPSIFVLGETGDNNRTIKHVKRKIKEPRDIKNTLYANAHKVSLSTIRNNRNYLSYIGYKVGPTLMGFQKVIQAPTFRLKMNVKYCELYGIFNEEHGVLPTVSTLFSYNLMDNFDMFIELGLLNYIRNNTSKLIETDMVLYTRIYYQKINEGIDYINSICTNRGLKNELLGMNGLGINSKNYLIKLNELGVKQLEPSCYDEIITEEEPCEINPDLFKEKYVSKLESTCKIDEYTYQIGEQLISRLKVLRVLECLRKQKNFVLEDALFYAITRNTLLDEKTYEEIKNTVLFLIDSPKFNGIIGLNR